MDMLDKDFYIVMCEQHYANSVSVMGVFKTREEAEACRDKSRLGSDVHIYGANFGEERPCC